MEYDSINLFLVPLTNAMIHVITLGIIGRCIFVITNMDNEDSNETTKKIKRKIKAAILSMTAIETINIIASFYLT